MKKIMNITLLITFLAVIITFFKIDYSKAFEPSVKVCPKSDIYCKVKYNGIEVESEKGKDETAIVIVD